MDPDLPTANPIQEIAAARLHPLPDGILQSTRPLVLRGLVADWPLVRAARRSAQDAAAYLRQFGDNTMVRAMLGPPEINGRFFYNADLSGFNFKLQQLKLGAVLDALLAHLDDDKPPAIYVGATAVDMFLPGLRADNDVDLGPRQTLFSAWIGNCSRVAPHQDVPDNLACVAAGRRRFTLFPPGQLANLYIGPLDFTPAGQAISLVDLADPDLDRFPKFADALPHAQVAELGPGDAIFIPSLWWHHIEALDGFNVLLNYWWRQSPAWMDSPLNALMLAILSLRDLPPEQRSAWQETFRHYVFEAGAPTTGHIPDHARRALAPLDAESAGELRAQLWKRLNR